VRQRPWISVSVYKRQRFHERWEVHKSQEVHKRQEIHKRREAHKEWKVHERQEAYAPVPVSASSCWVAPSVIGAPIENVANDDDDFLPLFSLLVCFLY
jgi:hypothetical protein